MNKIQNKMNIYVALVFIACNTWEAKCESAVYFICNAFSFDMSPRLTRSQGGTSGDLAGHSTVVTVSYRYEKFSF